MSYVRGTASDYLDLSDELVAALTGTSLQSVDSIANGGTGGTYVVGDILTLTGGTSTIAAQVEVTAVSAGQVTAVRQYNDGVYTSAPGDPVSTSGGGGTGCTLNCTFAANGWTANRDTTYSGSEKEVWVEGNGDGGDEIFAGWRTYSSAPDSRYNMELHGATGFDSGLDADEQPNVSPGFFDASSNSERAGCHLLLSNSSMQYWLKITSYYLHGTVKVGSHYFHFGFGWGDRYATETEYPYPMFVYGNSSTWEGNATQGRITSTACDPWKDSDSEGNAQGPLLIMGADNVWYGIANGSVGASSKTQLFDRVVIPCMRPGGSNTSPTEDEFYNLTTLAFSQFIPETGLSTAPAGNLHPTPGSGDDFRVLWPATIIFSDPGTQVMMDLPDLFWVSAFGGLVSEDRIIQNDEVFRVFQNCNRTDIWAYLAVKEQ